MRVVAVGGRSFVASFRLAGAGGVVAESAQEALSAVNRLVNSPDIALILVSDEFGAELSTKLNELRSKVSVPLIYEMPAPGSEARHVDYRALLRQVLGI